MKTPIPVLAPPICSAPRCRLVLAGLVLLALLAGSAQAATRIKQNNTLNLNLPGSWDTLPTAADIAQWDSAVTGPNTTVLGGSLTWAGVTIANPGGLVTINADGNTLTLGTAGTDIDMTAATADLTLNCGVTLGAAQTWNVQAGRTLTVGGVVDGGAYILTKKGAGTLILNGANTFSSVTVGDGSTAAGVLSIGNSGALGVGTAIVQGTGLAALYLSGGIAVPAANQLTINSAGVTGVDAYGNLRSLSGANSWAGQINGNSSPWIGCDAGSTLQISGGIAFAGTSRNVTFVGAGNITVNSVIGNLVGSVDHRLGTGTLTLSAANNYATSLIVYSGTVVVDYSTATVLKSTKPLTLTGGTLSLVNVTGPAVVSATTIGASGVGGAASVTQGSGTTSRLRMTAITRNPGGTVDFGVASIADTTTLNANGILGGYATVAGADWAINSTGGANGPVTAYTAYQTANAPASWAATDNVTLAGNPSASTGTQTINSLRLTALSAVQIGSGNTLTFTSGGLLVTGTAATSIAPASGTATLIGASGKDLIVIQNSSADLTISAIIADNTTATALTKSGSGRLILSGANAYTGTTYINSGILSVSANSGLGAVATGGSIVLAGGTLQATGTFALDNSGANKRAVALGETTTSTFDVSGNNVLTVSGVIQGRGWLTKTGTGTLALTGANSYSGDSILNGGTVNLGIAETVGSSGPLGIGISLTLPGVSGLIHFGGGALQYSAVNQYDYSVRFSPAASQSYSVDTAAQTVTWATPLTSSGGSLTVNDSVGGGKLTLSGVNTYTGATTISGGTLALTGSGSIANSPAIAVGAGATFDVSGVTGGTYSLASGQTLEGNGNIHGKLTVANGAFLAPGASIGTLTFDSNLTLLGTTSMEISKTAGTADKIVMSSGTVTLGGNLTVVNLAGTLAKGDTFTLIAGTIAGTFGSFTMPSLPTGLVWDTSQLSAGGNGTIKVACSGTLAANAGANQNICAGGGVAIGGSPTASGGSGTGYTYSWSPATGLNNATLANPTASPASTTTYTVTVTDSVGCAAQSSMMVNVSTLAAHAGPNQSVCSGSGVAIGGSPTATGGSGTGYTYSWSPGTALSSTTDPNPTASPASTTTYTVTVTDSLGCTALSSMTVNVNAAPAISTPPASQTVCSGSTATFSVTASGLGLNYSWAKNNNGGWGSAWTTSGSGSTFRASSTDNDFGDAACTSFSSAFDINSPSGNALGLWGGFSGDEDATRAFTALAAGQAVSIDFDNGNVDPGSKVGFSLQASGGADVLQFYFLGGASNYKYNDGAEHDTGIPFQRTGLRVQFVLTSASAYMLIVTPCGGTATPFTGSYAGTIAQLKLFNQNNTGGSDKNIYFNNFLVGGYTDNADNYSGDYAGQDKGDQPIASGNGGSTYTTPALSVADSGTQYQVVVYGCGGSALSSAATVTVNVCVASVTISNISGTTITYGGGAGAQFVLLKSADASAPLTSWSRVATNTVTPGMFTIPVVGTEATVFYSIKSE